jgi:TRAP transporter 4TM/12TM fusion protein
MPNPKVGNRNIAKVNKAISLCLVIMGLLYVTNILKPWIYVPIICYSAVGLGLSLTMVFLTFPIRKKHSELEEDDSLTGTRDVVPWYDFLFILLSLITTGYIAFFTAQWRASVMLGTSTPMETVFCFTLGLLIIEATRRTIGMALAITTLVFLIFAPISVDFNFARVATLMYFLSSGIVGTLVSLTFTVVLMFLLFGGFLQKTGAGMFFVNAFMALAGRFIGGTAKASVLSSCAVGMITGVGPANAAITGAITIPVMKESGYSPEFAAAVEGVAGNGSAIMPPVMGIAAFIMAEFLNMSYWSLCVAAFVPALLYYWGILIQVHFASKKQGILGLPREQRPVFWAVFKQGWFYLLPLAFLIYLLGVLNLPAEDCGMYAAFATIAVAIVDWQRKKKSRKSAREISALVIDTIDHTGKTLIIPAVACAGAGIIIAAISASGISFKIATILLDLAGGHLFLLLLVTALASFVLGLSLPPLPCYMIMAVLIAPALVKFGVPPLAAQLFVFYWGLSAEITPPVAVVVYVAAGIAKADPFKSGMLACRLGFLSFVLPFIFVYHNQLLLVGSIPSIVLTILTCFLAIMFIGAAFEGYLLVRLSKTERFLLFLGGALFLWPEWYTVLIGVSIIVCVMIWHIRSARQSKLKEQLARC